MYNCYVCIGRNGDASFTSAHLKYAHQNVCGYYIIFAQLFYPKALHIRWKPQYTLEEHIMNLISLGLRSLLFGLSTFGYLTFIHRYTKIKVEFLPAITFTGQICFLFLAGLLNLLPFAVIGIFSLGLLLTVFSLKDKKNYHDFFCIGYFFFIVVCLYFLLLFKGQVFNSYDNFSHWALVV